MKLARPTRAQHSETIIALIDVVFFLLVFFMLIGRMDATAPFDVAPPVATTGADMPSGGVTLAVGADGSLAFDGVATDATGFEQALAQRLADAGDLRLRVNAHRDAELRNVLPLVARAEALGTRDIVLVVTPEGKP
ncbi:ExbD/TolR family protein [Arenibacterium halophilum]|uniref:Biopolymer transporter ExbD n=1 Tax=Arenibacterium halophilum TaxID=2583821 RepID=A0ABY2X6D6_9RHOB|nr:biopolymer transporter ExbD [Arenibacterium halophilum]TMV11344.1 biopolymer transporter ExbD [Arenibacterium halophilum]